MFEGFRDSDIYWNEFWEEKPQWIILIVLGLPVMIYANFLAFGVSIPIGTGAIDEFYIITFSLISSVFYWAFPLAMVGGVTAMYSDPVIQYFRIMLIVCVLLFSALIIMFFDPSIPHIELKVILRNLFFLPFVGFIGFWAGYPFHVFLRVFQADPNNPNSSEI